MDVFGFSGISSKHPMKICLLTYSRLFSTWHVDLYHRPDCGGQIEIQRAKLSKLHDLTTFCALKAWPNLAHTCLECNFVLAVVYSKQSHNFPTTVLGIQTCCLLVSASSAPSDFGISVIVSLKSMC